MIYKITFQSIESDAIIQKANSITERILKAMEENENAPTLERIDREEFIIDFSKRDFLIAEADAELLAIRKSNMEENLKMRVIKNRIQNECWESMDVVGQSVKSFKENILTRKILEVTNYPIKKRTKEELYMAMKIKRLRAAEVKVQSAFQKSGIEKGDDVENEKAEKIVQFGFESSPENHILLFNPFEIKSKEKRRIQSCILRECIQDIKKQFNERFTELARNKQDEISRIEEKNERIIVILGQLGIQEEVYHPELDLDEVPENIITVKDSEVKIERVFSAEERRKEENKRRQEDERLRLEAEDNGRMRALMTMMNGKLDDKKEQNETIEIKRPDWMNKPKEEMNDEEKKAFKEFEKKLAIFKEEQDKAKKALETELRKLQSNVGEICDSFDMHLQECQKMKSFAENLIFHYELKVIKMGQACILGENDEAKEKALIDSLSNLKRDKDLFSAELPEIKKELDRTREDHEGAMKRDKEIEKQFKKGKYKATLILEFCVHEFYFDELTKLFKRRAIEFTAADVSEENLSLFCSNLKDSVECDIVAPLNPNTDIPEGISQEIWNKLVEIRDRKILAEQDVIVTGRYFKEMQNLLHSFTTDMEALRINIEKVTAELEEFEEYKFQARHNVEHLFELKQGQVKNQIALNF